MALQSPAKMQKEISLKIRIKTHRMKSPEQNASSSTLNRCSECGMSFSSAKALFGHLRVHRKSNRGAPKTSLLRLSEARHGEDVVAACILMGMRSSKSEADIDGAKLSRLKWICAKIERQRKKTKEVAKSLSGNCGMVASSMLALGRQSVGQCRTSSSDEEVAEMPEMVAPSKLAVVEAAEVAMHRCDKCDKVFNSGQALGGHKRAHYTGPPLCRPPVNSRKSQAAVAPEVMLIDIDLNERAEELVL